MSQNNPDRIKLSISMVIYTIWVLIFISDLFFGHPFFKNTFMFPPAALGFILAGLSCTVYLSMQIAPFKYSPSIILAVITIGGRTIAFTFSIFFKELTGHTLFLLTFGSVDFFLFYFVVIGLLKFLRVKDEKAKDRGVNILSFLPLLLFIVPIAIHPAETGITSYRIFTFLYTGTAALTISRAFVFFKAYPDNKLFPLSIILASSLDFIPFLYFTNIAEHLPLMLNYLLMPYSLFLLTYSLSAFKQRSL